MQCLPTARRARAAGAVVERRELRQWFLRTTAYADALLDGLDELDGDGGGGGKGGWPSRVRAAQAEWIGRSEGAAVEFPLLVDDSDAATDDENAPIRVFTTRADTLFGAAFVALSPQHPRAQSTHPAHHHAPARPQPAFPRASAPSAPTRCGCSGAPPTPRGATSSRR